MSAENLISELGLNLGIDLKLSEENTCGIFFDNDEVIIEFNEGQLYLIADLCSSAGREDLFGRLLAANFLGQESGQAVLSLDTSREEFTLHRIIEEDISYPKFEKILSVFVQSLRFWKNWLANPDEQKNDDNALENHSSDLMV